MNKIINNNLWSPVPWGWGCNGCNGGNNWLNNLFGYQMMFGMMNNMLGNLFAPQQRQQTQQTYNPYGCFYPGLSLGATQGNTNPSYEEYMEKIQAQNDLAQLKQTWNEFKFSSIGGKFQAVLKADKSVILDGDTTDELMSNIIGYVNENPAQFKTKEKEGAGGVDETGAEAGAGADAVADTGNDTGDGNEDKGTVKRKVKRDWYIASNAKNEDFRKAVTYEALSQTPNEAADKAADALIKAWGDFGKTVNKKELIKSLIQNNKSIFDKNGKLKEGADMNLFDVPTSKWAGKHLCKTNAQKELKQTMALKPGSSCVYEFYDENGTKISEKAFASKYPKPYLGQVATLKKKYWTPEDLRYALELYDKYIGGISISQDTSGTQTRTITNNNFKKFEVRTDNEGTHLWCDFKGFRGSYSSFTFDANNKGYFYGCLSDYYTEADLCNLNEHYRQERRLTPKEIKQQLSSSN